MIPPFDYFEHRRACKQKQLQRSTRIANLPSEYYGLVSTQDRHILDKPIEELVQDVQKNLIRPIDILRSYGKVALKAHAKTNCLTEIMINPGAEQWIEHVNLKGPLAGIPISLKDTITVGGFDTSTGYSRYTGQPHLQDGTIVKILKDAGAIPYVKTNIPITLLSFESTNDVWGRTTNPHNSNYSAGGSTGGESALLAFGGGRIGIGSDVAGSVRVPAHFAGIYSLRCSTGRWPKMGMNTSMPGQEGVPSVFSPMARTLPDLIYFTKSMIGMKPWEYDHSVHPIPWRDDIFHSFKDQKTLRIGVMESDGVVPPTPACLRALQTVTSSLSSTHTIIPLSPPSPTYALSLAASLLNADGARTFRSFFRTGETSDPGAAQLSFYMSLPLPIRYLHYLWTKYIRQDPLWADLLWEIKERSVCEQWKLVAKREAYRAEWHRWWRDEAGDVDVILTVPNATPAVPHGGMREAVASCGYTFLFNL
ncbi:MAG: hypothetical protein Q9223_005010, partial [Gallowayella weberi]